MSICNLTSSHPETTTKNIIASWILVTQEEKIELNLFIILRTEHKTHRHIHSERECERERKRESARESALEREREREGERVPHERENVPHKFKCVSFNSTGL